MALTLVTDYVLPNEPAYRLCEIVMTPHAMSKGGKRFKPSTTKGRRRWEIVWVNRGDRLAEHIRDMGPSSAYDYGCINIPSLWEHSVAELRDIAEQVRNDGQWEKDIIAQRQSESKLLEHAAIQCELRQKAGKSAFGPAISVQRNVSLRRR